ncbi:lasso peptide biosynthesis B2 protein [Aliiruegeria sabulilitoris]|uniref:lasso peptide biosynthesis B2 protein n=1 Tax=Aliiruegeria sabulilitoris TaxID=1510458 RepID=UPI0013D16E29|nr:lasso peptide biosynthesis B2 protein [Aliiruegeria sabulilitoris]
MQEHSPTHPTGKRLLPYQAALHFDNAIWFPMTASITRFLKVPTRRKILLVEAAFALVLGRVLTLFPMRIHTRFLGAERGETPRTLVSGQLETARRIGSAVERSAMAVPFKALCIEQTLAASLMLRIRGVPTTAYIGVHRDPVQRVADPRGYNAHAWLRAGDEVVIGGPDVSDYVPLAMFA